MEKVHRHLEENRFHIRSLKSRRHVHVHFQEPAHNHNLRDDDSQKGGCRIGIRIFVLSIEGGASPNRLL